jgi:hypothetical protein
VRTTPILFIATILLCACGGPTEKQAETKPPAAAPKVLTKPAPEDMRFPTAGRVDVIQMAEPLYGKTYLGGGNIAHYKKGKKEYELFLVKSPSPAEPGVMIFDYKKDLANAKFVAHFGGYAGQDAGVEVFVFTKGVWLAGVRGLPLAEAAPLAREFAARLD